MLRALLLSMVIARVGLACKCPEKPTPMESLDESLWVFVGRAVQIKDDIPLLYYACSIPEFKSLNINLGLPSGPRSGAERAQYCRRVTLDVNAIWKGPDAKRVEISYLGADCDFPFEDGKYYLVYLREECGTLGTTICDRTHELLESDPDIRALGAPRAGRLPVDRGTAKSAAKLVRAMPLRVLMAALALAASVLCVTTIRMTYSIQIARSYVLQVATALILATPIAILELAYLLPNDERLHYVFVKVPIYVFLAPLASILMASLWVVHKDKPKTRSPQRPRHNGRRRFWISAVPTVTLFLVTSLPLALPIVQDASNLRLLPGIILLGPTLWGSYYSDMGSHFADDPGSLSLVATSLLLPCIGFVGWWIFWDGVTGFWLLVKSRVHRSAALQNPPGSSRG